MRIQDIKKLIDPELYGASKSMTGVANAAIWAFHGKEWLNNAEANAPILSNLQSVGVMFNTAPDETILVVAAGPSAKENIEYIKIARDRGIKIVAVDKIFNFLCDNGVKPDVTVTLDAQLTVADMFDPKHIENSLIVVSPTLHPATIIKLETCGARMLLNIPIAPGEIWGDIAECYGRDHVGLRTGFVVTFSAVDLAYWAGAKRIITIGNELSWKNKEDAIGYIKLVEKVYDLKHQVSGRTVWSISAFRKAARLFQGIAYAHPDVEWIDCSRGIVEGWKIMSMSEALRNEKKSNILTVDFSGSGVHPDVCAAVPR